MGIVLDAVTSAIVNPNLAQYRLSVAFHGLGNTWMLCFCLSSTATSCTIIPFVVGST